VRACPCAAPCVIVIIYVYDLLFFFIASMPMRVHAPHQVSRAVRGWMDR
jgi:hypothetical protein